MGQRRYDYQTTWLAKGNLRLVPVEPDAETVSAKEVIQEVLRDHGIENDALADDLAGVFADEGMPMHAYRIMFVSQDGKYVKYIGLQNGGDAWEPGNAPLVIPCVMEIDEGCKL